MNKLFQIRRYFFLIFFISADLLCQNKLNTVTVIDTFQINRKNSYKISSLNIIPFTERLVLTNKILSLDQYKISCERGVISLSDTLKPSWLDILIVTYQCINISLQREYKRRSLQISYDDKYADTLLVIQKEQPFLTPESIFGENIQKSGAIIRGFTIGTNHDFSLNSGLRLQLSGRLSEDVEIVAALTDENTPIQPEGNTETLEELDKVFIELRHKNAIGTFGDYELNERENELSQVTRKLQGLKGEFKYDDLRGVIAVAGARGKFNNNQFYGLDGNQGPFRLFGINNERAIIIIAGSEKVYLNGELLKRGENNDYIIDYSNSEITFTPKRLITSASRISVDFEYTDQNYRRNFFGADFSTNFFEDRLKVGVSYYREGDDENNPIDLSLSASDIGVLRNAGDSRNNAVRSGVSISLPDSLGRILGIYSKVDTTINNQPFIYYIYAPGKPNSIYNVSFSYVGEGNGDYLKESLGKYQFVGRGKGTYLPLTFLPLPELKQIGNLSLHSTILKGVNIDLELSGSDWDKNRFSQTDDSDNFGYARKISLNIEPKEIIFGGTSFGKIAFNIKERFIQKKYSTLDRINAVEFNRYYNLNNVESSDQVLREIGLDLFPVKQISLISKYGYLKQGDAFKSYRFLTNLKIFEPQQYQIDYNFDFVNSTNNSINTKWNKQNGQAFYSYGIFKPGVEFLYENKEDLAFDSLLASSLQYFEIVPYLEVTSNSLFNIRASYSFREEAFPFKNELVSQSKAFTQQYQIGYKGLKGFSTSLNIAHRNKKYKDEFEKIGFKNNETILFLSQSRFNFWEGFVQGDLYYQAATEQTTKLEKVFLRVSKGTGSYIYLGDLNNNGIPEENEFQLSSYDGEFILVMIPTDKLFPVIDLKTNTRWKIDFSRLIIGKDFWSSAIKAISTETFWRIEENSKDEITKDIYLLKFSKFLNDSNTMRGSQLFQHDINLFQNSNEFSVRLRFIQRKNINQFSGGVEKGYFRERSMRIRFRMISEINNQTEITNQVDNLKSPQSSNRARTVTRSDIITEFSYRPINNVEVGFKIQAGRSEDEFPIIATKVDINSVTLRVNLSLPNFGRLRIEVERTELTSNTKNVNIPFEITRGNVIGKNYFWRAFFDYKIANYIQTSISYDARLQGNSRIIHTMRAEARAYF